MNVRVLKTILADMLLPACLCTEGAVMEESCPSLMAVWCPEIIRLIKEHNLSAYRSVPAANE